MNLSRVAMFVLAAICVVIVVLLLFPARGARAFPDNCGLHPSNLFRNGSMAPGHTTPYGTVALEWTPFVITGSPRFEWVDNEKWDANGAQYFWSDSVPFDAGIYQTVWGLQPNVYYRFRIGYSHARLDPGNAKNEVHPSMGRQVGVDPFGGTDPKSPNVIWGPALFNSTAGMNPPELTMTFAARADKATMFFRGIFTGASGRAKVWFDVACMEAVPDMPTATAVPPTVTPSPIAPPTRTPTRPVTKIAQGPTATNTPLPPTATRTPTPTSTTTPTPSATPRYARPAVTPTPSLPIDPATGALTGLGVLSLMFGFVSLGTGIFLWSKS
ncbi:MAG: hypothetical protein N2559_01645 [Anaerolineae bacterium]|nr:hypothetical protein [Anaerolineae bacterium]